MTNTADASDGTAARRVALITGCGLQDGLGAAAARALAREKIAVMVSDVKLGGVAPSVDPDLVAKLGKSAHWHGLESLVEEIQSFGGTASYTIGDVSSEEDAQRMVRETYDTYGSVDILVNNAATSQTLMDIEDLSLELFERIFAVNVRGTFLMSRAAVKYMRQRRWGRIVNISSISAEQNHAGFAGFAASKAALLGFTRALAADVGPQGITVMAVSPGLMLTARGKIATHRMYGDDLEQGARQVGVRRYGVPEDIANVIRFIASEDSGYLSGEVIRVSGGGGI
jgi:NAD(P)-dependent dehydrogenase (short-subunit alcohol dehydrogenase family)